MSMRATRANCPNRPRENLTRRAKVFAHEVTAPVLAVQSNAYPVSNSWNVDPW